MNGALDLRNKVVIQIMTKGADTFMLSMDDQVKAKGRLHNREVEE